jgi:hypothetical protein
MRVIKFRAWWRDTGKPVKDFNDEYIIDACNDDAFIVDQFTGLLDSKGKEIYEGDFLKRPDCWPKYRVYFCTEKARFMADSMPLSDINEEATVIGNIHEEAADVQP